MRRLKWAVALLLCLTLVLSGCGLGKKDSGSVVKDLNGVVEKMQSYHGTGQMILRTGQEPQEYQVEVCYQAPAFYRIALTNDKKDITQIVLRNNDGVFVLTPHLNKSFRFQSDWPENQGQVYLYQSLVQSILKDNERQFTSDDKAYVFDVAGNYQNSSLARQKVWLNKKTYEPQKVEVSDANSNVVLVMNFDKFEFGTKFEKDYFDMQRNMTSWNTSHLPTMAQGDTKAADSGAKATGTNAGGAAAGSNAGSSASANASGSTAGTGANAGASSAVAGGKTDGSKAAAGNTGANGTSGAAGTPAGSSNGAAAGASTNGAGTNGLGGKEAAGTNGTAGVNGAAGKGTTTSSTSTGATGGNASSTAGAGAANNSSGAAANSGSANNGSSNHAAGNASGTTASGGGTTGTTNTKQQSFGVIEPRYLPTGVKKQDSSEIQLGDDKAVMIRYSGKYNYTLVESHPTTQTVSILPGDIVDLGFTLAVVTGDAKKTLTWTYDGVEFRLSTGDLPMTEMIKVAQAVQGEMGK